MSVKPKNGLRAGSWWEQPAHLTAGPHNLGKMPGGQQPLWLMDLFPKAMETHVFISCNQWSCLLVKAKQG